MKIFTCALIASLLLAGCGSKHDKFGAISETTGTVEVFRDGRWSPAQIEDVIRFGDSLRTQAKSSVSVQSGKNTIKLGENTCITVTDTVGAQKKKLIAVLNLVGEVVSDLKDLGGAQYEVWTPTSVAHAQGTYFVVVFTPEDYKTNVRVLHGRVSVINPFMPDAPEVIVLPGYYTVVPYDAGPVAAVPITRRQFKKLQKVLDDDDYVVYEQQFIRPEMPMDAPIVIVHAAPVVVRERSPYRNRHGQVIVVAPFMLPPAPPRVHVRASIPVPQPPDVRMEVHPGVVPVPVVPVPVPGIPVPGGIRHRPAVRQYAHPGHGELKYEYKREGGGHREKYEYKRGDGHHKGHDKDDDD